MTGGTPFKSETIPISAVGANVTKVQQMLIASASNNPYGTTGQSGTQQMPGTDRAFLRLRYR